MPEHLRITVFFTNRRKHTFVNFMECLPAIRTVCNALGKLFPCAPFIIISGCRIENTSASSGSPSILRSFTIPLPENIVPVSSGKVHHPSAPSAVNPCLPRVPSSYFPTAHQTGYAGNTMIHALCIHKAIRIIHPSGLRCK